MREVGEEMEDIRVIVGGGSDEESGKSETFLICLKDFPYMIELLFGKPGVF